MDDTLTKSQSKLADTVAELVTDAALDDAFKERIIDRLDRLSEPVLVELVRWLSDRNAAVHQLEHELTELLKTQEERWSALEKEQKSAAEAMVTAEVDAILKESDLDASLAASDE